MRRLRLTAADDGLLLFRDGLGQGLFAVNIFFVVGGFNGDERMPMVRHGQHDGINIIARHHFAVIPVARAILVAVMAVDRVECRVQMMRVEIAGGTDHLAITLREERSRVARPLHAPTDDAQRDAFRRGRPVSAAERAGRDDGGQGDKAEPAVARKWRRVIPGRDEGFFIIDWAVRIYTWFVRF